MTLPTILVATWQNGLHVLTHGHWQHEWAGQSVCGLASDGGIGALAIVGKQSLRRRAADGTWSTIADSEIELSCCLVVGALIYAGTDDAGVLRVREDGRFEPLRAFGEVAGRDTWYAGAAIIDGRRVGPPLGVRSMSATCDHAALLANVHVGGIPRSQDGGASWRPTIDIDTDVHQVCAHPSRPEVLAAAAGVGLCLSRDAGLTWSVEREGLHAAHCTAVAFAEDEVLVSAATDHFASQGAIYRRSLESDAPILRADGGLPSWLSGITDTRNIAVRGAAGALVDRGGNLYVSQDAGRSWAPRADHLGLPSSVLIP
jgi:hypothetical protein